LITYSCSYQNATDGVCLLVSEEEEDQGHVGKTIIKWTGLKGDLLLRSVEDRISWQLIMVALWNRADHYIFILWFLSI